MENKSISISESKEVVMEKYKEQKLKITAIFYADDHTIIELNSNTLFYSFSRVYC